MTVCRRYGPALRYPIRGRPAARLVCAALKDALDDLELLHELHDDNVTVLILQARVAASRPNGRMCSSAASISSSRQNGSGTRPPATLDVFSANVHRRGENTLGLFISINGFEPTAVEIHSGNRSPIVLMDGTDLYAVRDNRIDLRVLLRRKRRETSMTGRVLLTAGKSSARTRNPTGQG